MGIWVFLGLLTVGVGGITVYVVTAPMEQKARWRRHYRRFARGVMRAASGKQHRRNRRIAANRAGRAAIRPFLSASASLLVAARRRYKAVRERELQDEDDPPPTSRSRPPARERPNITPAQSPPAPPPAALLQRLTIAARRQGHDPRITGTRHGAELACPVCQGRAAVSGATDAKQAEVTEYGGGPGLVRQPCPGRKPDTSPDARPGPGDVVRQVVSAAQDRGHQVVASPPSPKGQKLRCRSCGGELVVEAATGKARQVRSPSLVQSRCPRPRADAPAGFPSPTTGRSRAGRSPSPSGYVCGAPCATKGQGPGTGRGRGPAVACQRPVAAEGDRCYQHQGAPAIAASTRRGTRG